MPKSEIDPWNSRYPFNLNGKRVRITTPAGDIERTITDVKVDTQGHLHHLVTEDGSVVVGTNVIEVTVLRPLGGGDE